MSTLHVEFDNSLAELQRELAMRSYYPDGGEAIVPMHLLRRLNDAMIWAGDEVTQVREDLHGAMGLVRELTEENEFLLDPRLRAVA